MDHDDALPREPRPREFAARYSRARPRSLARIARKQHSGRRALALLAAVAVPAMAAPSDWVPFHIGSAGTAELDLEPMPFEKPGSSFPGSAFYYLTTEEAPVQRFGEGIHSDADNALTQIDPWGGPVARAMRVDNSGVDRSRALQCLTAAVYYEAASEPDSGQRAVAQVVLNRVAHPSYPNTVCGVVYQGSERRTGCQFSFTCDGSLARVPGRMFWQRAERTAADALAGYVHAPAGLATHYHTVAIHPYWAPSLNYLGTIGAHRFYKFAGRAGQPDAYRFAYLGGEPVAAPHRRNAAADNARDAALDPAALQRAYEEGFKQAQGQAVTPVAGGGVAPVRHAPPPVYSEILRERGGDALYKGENLPDASGIKPEYRNSGRWIAKPGT